MSSPNINRFEKNVKKIDISIDSITKMFFIIEIFFGKGRLGVFDKVKLVSSIPVIIYCLCVNAIFTYFVLTLQTEIYVLYIVTFNVTCHFINTVLSFLFCNKYREFFEEIKSFDTKVGLKSGVGLPTIQNVVVWGIFMAIHCAANIALYMMSYSTMLSLCICIMQVAFTTELFSYGHLMTLLLQRLYHIKETVISCLHKDGATVHRANINKREQCRDTTEEEIRELVFYYYGIVKAFDALNAAIKYQFLVMLLETFITSIYYWNSCAIDLASRKMNWQIMPTQMLIVFLASTMPFFSPSHFANQIKVEVCIISDSIRSNLHKLDENKRKAANLLLSLTNARTLTFSVFRMISVDILLPFKMLGYIATYLIVILQFEKISGSN